MKTRKKTNDGEYTARAIARHVRISPQKLRLVMNLIRGKQVETALQILAFNPRKGARIAEKLLKSAISNAREKANVDVDKLWVSGGYVDEGAIMKRVMPRAQGRADVLSKRSAHLSLFVAER